MIVSQQISLLLNPLMYFFLQFKCQNPLSLKNFKWGYHCSVNICFLFVCLLATHIVSQSISQVVLKVCENLVCSIVAEVFSLNWVHCLEGKKICVSEASSVFLVR